MKEERDIEKGIQPKEKGPPMERGAQGHVQNSVQNEKNFSLKKGKRT